MAIIERIERKKREEERAKKNFSRTTINENNRFSP